MDFDRIINNNGIYLYEDNSFNTVTIRLNFLAGNSNRDAAIIDLLCYYLMSSNQNFETDDDIDDRKKELYSLHLNFGNNFYSNQKIVSLYANLISSNVIGDDYYEDAFDFIRQILKEPDFTDEKMLNIIKRNMISDVKLDLMDTESYASNMYYYETLYEENKEYEYSTDIDYISELINSITLDELKEEYEYIISNFQSGLVFGNINEEQFNSFVKHIDLKPINEEVVYERSLPSCEKNIELEKDSEQSYIYVTYDIDDLTYPELKLLSNIMNSSTGLCYQTLREKYGLVYNSYAAIMFYLKKLYIYGEIDKEKKDKFVKAADEIIMNLNNKELLDELIIQSKSEINANEITFSEDQDRMVDSFNSYIMKLYGGLDRNEINNQINSTTSEDILKSTKTLKRKNVFMVRSNRDE